MAAVASNIFGALVRARERAYAQGRLGVARLPAPVVSIGNIRVGGSGKTPAVIALGRALREAAGLRIDVLTRGYRRAHRGLAVAQSGDEDVEVVGDEPRLIARELQAPVMVHPDRFRAGLEAERRFASQLHLLDDGFQHRQLARVFDLVLVAESDLDDRLLPAGRLREPPSALARAHAIGWLHGTQNAEQELARARERLREFSAAPVFLARKVARPVVASARPYAFCGLARPESFWSTLAELGIEPAGRQAFRDHHRYRPSGLSRLQTAATACGADGFVTTAKDAMNLPEDHRLPELRVIDIEMEFSDLAGLTGMILKACRA